jgi:SAM-dependent methyltransferase
MTTYGPYAAVYDDAGQTAFGLRMIRYLDRLLGRHPVGQGPMLDLACGTGTVAVAMASGGWHVYGVDGSAEMLDVARTKGDSAKVQVAWSQQDMRSLVLPTSMSLVTCLYDSLNYMLGLVNLNKALSAVASVLRPEGLFICDVSTPTAFDKYANRTFHSAGDGLDMIHSCSADAGRRRLTVDITGFVLVEGGLYSRFTEKHEQWAPTEREMRGALRRAGLVVEGCYDCFSLSGCGADSVRCAWVARKPTAAAGHS